MEIQINQKTISDQEFNRAFLELKKQYSNLKEKLSEAEFAKVIFKLTKDKLIKNTLLLEEAEKTILPPAYKEIKKKYNEIKEHFEKNPPNNFVNQLNPENEFMVKENIEKFLWIEKLLAHWTSVVEKNQAEKAYIFFKDNPQLFNFEKYSLFSRISCDVEYEDQLKELYFNLKQETTKLYNFNRVFHSINPSWGGKISWDKKLLIKRGSLAYAIEEIIFFLKEGEYSGIIKTNQEVSIFLKLMNLDFKELKEKNLEKTKPTKYQFDLIEDLVLEVYLKETKKRIIEEKVNALLKKASINFRQ